MLYTNRCINLISFIITFLIFLFFNFYSFNFNFQKENLKDISKIIPNNDELKNEVLDENNLTVEVEDLGNWYIEIPAINLKAPIAEGTNLDVLQTKIGHFESTSNKVGNIGLAAHNRGYQFNYFENLKKLKLGDEIFYRFEDFEKEYVVDTIEIIKNTNWDYLEATGENKITLITCIENEPEYRRCVQGTEI